MVRSHICSCGLDFLLIKQIMSGIQLSSAVFVSSFKIQFVLRPDRQHFAKWPRLRHSGHVFFVGPSSCIVQIGELRKLRSTVLSSDSLLPCSLVDLVFRLSFFYVSDYFSFYVSGELFSACILVVSCACIHVMLVMGSTDMSLS